MDTSTLGILILMACGGVALPARRAVKLASLAIALGLGIAGMLSPLG